MPGETDLHKTLKKEGCRWLFRMGYRCIAAEVKLEPLGIIDAVGTGLFRPYHNYLSTPTNVHQTVFIECKASRADFLRDHTDDGQLTFALDQKRRHPERRKFRKLPKRHGGELGKFQSCLVRPMANLHYVLAPAGLLKKEDLPPRWGLLTLGEGGIGVTVRPAWLEVCRQQFVEGAIARTLTGDIYRADDRAMGSVNREIFAQQQQLAERIRNIKPLLLGQAVQQPRTAAKARPRPVGVPAATPVGLPA